MKLAALGVVTVCIGVALSIPGLIGIGAFWVAMGAVVRSHGKRLEEKGIGLKPARTKPGGATSAEPLSEGLGSAEDPAAAGLAAMDGRTFALGTAIWLALGIPSLAVGILELGLGADDEAWRWLPIAVGGLALGIGVLGAVLYLAGSALSAAGGGTPTIPATVRIRAVRETGTFVNERPRLEFDLTVEPDPGSGVTAYEVTKKATVPFTAMGSLRVGDGFKALVVGPESPTTMEIDWDAPVAGARGAVDGAGAVEDVSSRLDELEELRRDAKISEEEYQAQRQRILGSL